MSALHKRMIQKGGYLCISLVALGLAILNPKVNLPLDFHQYLFVIDITQSMNVEDMSHHDKPVSRLNYTVQLVDSTLQELPCGTKVSAESHKF